MSDAAIVSWDDSGPTHQGATTAPPERTAVGAEGTRTSAEITDAPFSTA
jgi:hypothetical protein